MKDKIDKFQWISLIYLILFVLAVFAPSLVTHPYFGLSEQYIEELLIFLFGVTGVVIFMFYEKLIKAKEDEDKQIKNNWKKTKGELLSSYQYIGSLNRKIDTLKQLVNDTSLSINEQKASIKTLLLTIASAASSNFYNSPVMIRCVMFSKLRTEHEVVLNNKKNRKVKFNVPNKELQNIYQQGLSHAIITNNQGVQFLIIPSEHTDKEKKVFLIFLYDPDLVKDFDITIFKVFANQAEVVYHIFKQDSSQKSLLKIIDSATENIVGEVE